MRFDTAHRASLAAASTRAWQDPEKRARIINARLIAYDDPLWLALNRRSKAGRPRVPNCQEDRKPWRELGMSRSSYFRWRKANEIRG